ncbi:MAG: response regulator [Pseudomonadota bacterium]
MADTKTVLVVDDSRMTRMMIRTIIENHHPNWELLEADCGEQALQVCQGKAIDIMTLDVNMPGMNGLELGEEMRKRYPMADISLVTANIQDSIREQAEASAFNFVAKPITEDRIMGYIQAVA